MRLRNTLGFILLLFLVIVALTPCTSAEPSCSAYITSIPDEAMIRIDGQFAGATPLGITLPCENHTIVVEKNGYEPYRTQVLLTQGEQRRIVANLEYRSKRGSVIIRSQPFGGTLYVDGVQQGNTPVQVDNLVYGRHAVLIKKPGYLDLRDDVTAGPGPVPEYMEYLIPEPGTGFVGVTSAPDGADVVLDGAFFGTTPTRLEAAFAGNHTILLRMQGYENYTTFVEVPGGDSVLVRADLVKVADAGMIVLDSEPQGAEVFINGTFKALTPAVFENVPQGVYFIQLQKRNYSEVNFTLTLDGGETHEVYGDLVNRTSGTNGIFEQVYQLRSNASKTAPGSIDTTPSIDQTYTWYTNGHEATVRLRIPQELYDHYKGLNHRPQSVTEYKPYALDEKDRAYLHDLIGMLKDAGENKNLAARNDYRNAVSFVQSITYEKDLDPITKQETEYWKYPIETLADGSGDCEDTAILTAALLKEMGYDVAMVLLSDHAAVAVACDNCNGYYYPLDGKRYYFLETTGAGYSLGTMDEKKYQSSAARIIPI